VRDGKGGLWMLWGFGGTWDAIAWVLGGRDCLCGRMGVCIWGVVYSARDGGNVENL
jgi:hypothetical protein